ncbi:metal ABC transporter permease [Candidatus Tisiphia endosymbiont of Micropterix aruncella]|uniref:metal ABC transporter permease n=1 Tax=Candidatus Tisiphia endosymbiont of Micropterix aruncella TaxID=3066271 RepID=UPI003AA9217C
MTIIILTIILISLIFAPLGCISLWKKYIYFGDGLSHASLLAGSISILAHLPVVYSGLVVAVIFAILVFTLKHRSGGSSVVMLISSFMLSLALVVGYMYPLQIKITNLLFGDILSASLNDILTLSIILIFVISFVWYFYSQIILIVINRDIAQIKGVKVRTIELAFLLLLSLSVFSTIKIVGALLVTSILLIPAMTARMISSNPAQMIINSVIVALIVDFLGLVVSLYLDIPITPIITVINTIVYCLFYIISRANKAGFFRL